MVRGEGSAAPCLRTWASVARNAGLRNGSRRTRGRSVSAGRRPTTALVTSALVGAALGLAVGVAIARRTAPLPALDRPGPTNRVTNAADAPLRVAPVEA